MSNPGKEDFSWNPQDYDFNPYELTVRASEKSEKEEKKRSGRSKRLSVLCQVKADRWIGHIVQQSRCTVLLMGLAVYHYSFSSFIACLYCFFNSFDFCSL